MPDLVVAPEPAAQLNVTFSGQNGDYPDAVDFNMSDTEILRIATEALQTGYVPGIDPAPDADLTDFVVDRFEAKDNLPQRLVIRPKVPFGVCPRCLNGSGSERDNLCGPCFWAVYGG